MTRDEFTAELARADFQEIVTVEWEANGFLDTHTHPFEAKALVVAGELCITTASGECTYRVGDIFHLAAAEPHQERYGPSGVTYLVGRKR